MLSPDNRRLKIHPCDLKYGMPWSRNEAVLAMHASAEQRRLSVLEHRKNSQTQALAKGTAGREHASF
jgi:hypothetical protein